LVGEGWVSISDLKGLSEEKLRKIRVMIEIGGR
jgi:hypothetical protein